MILGALGEFLVGNTFPFVVFGSFGMSISSKIAFSRLIGHRRLLAQLCRNPPTILQRIRSLLSRPNKPNPRPQYRSIPLLLRLLLHRHGSHVFHLHDPLPPNQHRLLHYLLHPGPRLWFPSRRLLSNLEWKFGVSGTVTDGGWCFYIYYLCVWLVDFFCYYACRVGLSVSITWYVRFAYFV